MKRSMCWLMTGLVLCAVTGTGQDIISFEKGMITFDNPDTNMYYRVEFKPWLTGPESAEWLTALPVNIRTSDAEVTVPAGVFYRVAASASPFAVEDGGSTYNAAVPKTGQTVIYKIGDDGDLEMGVSWPDPRFTDNEDGTVTDNLTGLMWVKAPHSLDGNSGTMTWSNTIDFCNDLGFAGHTDWRMPNLRELQSLVNYGRYNPALPWGHPFTGVQSARYWSSSVLAYPILHAWYVDLISGQVDSYPKTSTYRVWPVRGGHVE